MNYIQSTILAIIQGLSEFLPISSSAHLILPSQVLGWPDQGLAFDVAVHLGTLGAVIIYFRKEIISMLNGLTRQLTTGKSNTESRLAWLLVLATVPVLLAGFLLKDIVDEHFRNTQVIATTTIIFAIFLWMADKYGLRNKGLAPFGWKGALVVGLAQVLALIPGTSRSGVTMTAALACGLDRESASRFSFLLSIPVIAGASLLITLDLLKENQVDWFLLAYSTVLSGCVAWLCIYYFLKFINQMGFLPFILYRFALGAALFLMV